MSRTEAAGDPPHGTFRPSGPARALLALARLPLLGRGSARRLLGRAFISLHPGPADVFLWGAPVRLHPQGNVAENRALLNPARFNRAELDAIAARLKRTGSVTSAVFVDIGANAGLFSLHAARMAPAGTTILAFEPNGELFARMRFNLRREGLGRDPGAIDLRLMEMALGETEGAGLLHADAGELGSGHIAPAGAQGTHAGMSVRMRPLAAVLADEGIGHVTVMKIDVEGYEDRVLGPFFATAPRDLWPDTLIIEHLSRPQWAFDCIGELVARGYRATRLSRSNTLLERV